MKNDFRKLFTKLLKDNNLKEIITFIGSDERLEIHELLDEAYEIVYPNDEDIDDIIKFLSSKKKKSYRPKELIEIIEDEFELSEANIRGLFRKYQDRHFNKSRFWITVL